MNRRIHLLRPSLLLSLLSAHPSKTQNPTSLSYLGASSSLQTSPPSLSPFTRFSSASFIFSSRHFASSPSPSSMVPIGSEEGFNTALKKAQDEKLPTIFYFSAVWCGPCKLIAPKLEEMSKTFPHVTTYKIDIDQEGLGSILSKLQISAVPTFHFFQNGKKAAEIVGADIAKLKDTMENLYK